jgi:hypothetical protein
MRCPHCNVLFNHPHRRDIVIEHEGVPMSLLELGERVGIAYSTLRHRYVHGDRGERLIRTPDQSRARAFQKRGSQ